MPSILNVRDGLVASNGQPKCLYYASESERNAEIRHVPNVSPTPLRFISFVIMPTFVALNGRGVYYQKFSGNRYR